MGAAEQRYVARVLVISEPNDPRDSVGGPLLVRHPEALDPQYAEATPCKVEQGSAAESADPDNNHVKGLGAIHSCSSRLDHEDERMAPATQPCSRSAYAVQADRLSTF